DRDGNGVSGRANRVPDRTQSSRVVIGRFGWKAEQPSVLQQSAAAFAGDMGITSSLFSEENRTQAQAAAHSSPSGGSPEIDDEALQAVALYAGSLAVPARRGVNDPKVRQGEELFLRAGCADCHVPTLTTGPFSRLVQIPKESIHPYTDLLLHDLGPGLSDERPSFAASGAEWRTAPLWGLGLVPKVNGHSFLLHDGRARNVSEAILWHGGEAERARRNFSAASRSERAALLAFLESL
ncbi:MAG TPA: di-heme oxidoredictase family protein, partial [Polyangiaceae bacterium]